MVGAHLAPFFTCCSCFQKGAVLLDVNVNGCLFLIRKLVHRSQDVACFLWPWTYPEPTKTQRKFAIGLYKSGMYIHFIDPAFLWTELGSSFINTCLYIYIYILNVFYRSLQPLGKKKRGISKILEAECAKVSHCESDCPYCETVPRIDWMVTIHGTGIFNLHF